jgi:PqqD family protein of HPr-rel-A system
MTEPIRHKYKAEPDAMLLIQPLDAMTAVYHRRSGITHIVSEPVPQILQVMGGETLTSGEIMVRLNADFDFEGVDAENLITDRLDEMASLGLVEQHHA